MQSDEGRAPRCAERGRFAAFRSLLQDTAFTTPGVFARLGIASLFDFVPLRKGREAATEFTGPLDALIRLFMDEECCAEADLRRLLPPGALELMEALGLAARLDGEPDQWFATATLQPVGPLYIAADRSSTPEATPFTPAPDVVYPVSEQTLHFLDSLPRTRCERLLDLGTGTGIAALQGAAEYAGHTWAFDITERSAHFARFNALLNGLENVTVGRGDLYEPAAGIEFDRIVAHPPYVPVAEPTFVFRDGGEDGEQVLRRIVEGLPAHLAPGGCFHGYGMASDREGEFFEERIRRWLGPAASEFDVILVANATLTPDGLKSPRSPEERQHWARVFEACRVKYLFHGAMLVQRHEAPRGAFTVRSHAGPRSGWKETEWLRRWMTAAAGAGERLVLEARPVVAPGLELRTVHRVRGGRLQPEKCSLVTDYPFQAECVCQPWIAQMVAGCDGSVTGWELFARCGRENILDPKCSPADFARVLVAMISGGFVLIPDFAPPDESGP